MESLGTSPGALPSGGGRGSGFPVGNRFHRYWANSSKSTVWPKMEFCFQDGACSVCFLLQWDLNSPTRDETCISCPGRRILYHWTTREDHRIFKRKIRSPLSPRLRSSLLISVCISFQSLIWSVPLRSTLFFCGVFPHDTRNSQRAP